VFFVIFFEKNESFMLGNTWLKTLILFNKSWYAPPKTKIIKCYNRKLGGGAKNYDVRTEYLLLVTFTFIQTVLPGRYYFKHFREWVIIMEYTFVKQNFSDFFDCETKRSVVYELKMILWKSSGTWDIQLFRGSLSRNHFWLQVCYNFTALVVKRCWFKPIFCNKTLLIGSHLLFKKNSIFIKFYKLW